MSDSTRRGFLQGVFGGVTAAGVIVAASPDDVAAFTSPVGTPVTLQQPRYHTFVQPGEELYNANGQIVAIVDSVGFHRNKIETTTHDVQYEHYTLGILRVDIRARGISHEALGQVVRCPYCKSSRHPSLPCRSCGAGAL